MLIHCPWCGDRDLSEFSYGGDASRIRPGDLDAADRTAWMEYVYLRDNPRGHHLEYWHHVAGCRQWIRVQRDTLTHRLGAVGLAQRSEGTE